MRHKLIVLFLFFELVAHCVEAKRVVRSETLSATSRNNRSVVATFLLLNPKQIRRAETTIKHFLTKLTEPLARPITPRIFSSDGSSLQKTIREICEIVRAKVTEFARACGLTASARRYERTPWNSTTLSEDWFSEGLLQGSLLLRDLIGLGEQVRFAIDQYFDIYNVTLRYDGKLPPHKATRRYKFLSVVNDGFDFSERLFRCSRSIRGRKKGAFDLNRTLADLARGSTNNTVTAFKSVLVRALLHRTPDNGISSKRLYASLCHSLIEKAGRRGDCVKQLRRLEACALPTRRDIGEVIVGRTFPLEPWFAAIQDLSGCEIYIDASGGASVRCDLVGRVPRTTVRRVEYIYEKILDRRISRRSPLHRVAHELGNALSRSEWGRRFTYDVCQYFAIYQEGRGRLNRLSRNAAGGVETAIRYKKMSQSLDLYKSGALRKTILVIGNFHRSALEAQRFLIRGTRRSSRQSWHLEILDRLSDWMTKLLELFGCTLLDDTDVDASFPLNVSSINDANFSSVMTSDDLSDGSDQISFEIYRNKEIRKETDEAFERLLQSMNRVSSVRSQSDKSTLECLSNNLLLVTMFMETISLVSTLFCLGKTKNEPNSQEYEAGMDST